MSEQPRQPELPPAPKTSGANQRLDELIELNRQLIGQNAELVRCARGMLNGSPVLLAFWVLALIIGIFAILIGLLVSGGVVPSAPCRHHKCLTKQTSI